MNKTITGLTSIVIVALLLTACGSTAQADSLPDRVWTLTQITTPTLTQTLNPTDLLNPTLEFKKETGAVAGNGGCNGFGGNYETTANNEIDLKDIFSTMMACDNLPLETAYFAALDQATTYTIQNDQLQLATADGSVVLTFVAESPEGTK